MNQLEHRFNDQQGEIDEFNTIVDELNEKLDLHKQAHGTIDSMLSDCQMQLEDAKRAVRDKNNEIERLQK